METDIYVADMQVGDRVEGFYILKDAVQKTTMNGKPFLSGSLADRSGTIELKVWDYPGPLGAGDAGSVVKVSGEVSEFKGVPQFTAERIRPADGNDRYDASALVPTAPIDAPLALSRVRELAESIEDEDYKKIALTLLERHMDSFSHIPAAKSVHHGFINGLLMHTVNMLETADFLSGLYSYVIDRSLLLAGTLLHDFAKEREFTFSALGMVTDYSVRGDLLGHLVMGAQEIAETAKELGVPEEKSVLLQHLILSHHGEPEFGAAVRSQCAEAELLSYIDSIDSRMEIYTETFETVPAGQFSPRIFALEKKIYNHG